MAEVLTVLTYKGARHIVADHGSESWVISPYRARRCAYIVCVRHQQGPWKAEGDEPHKHAFLVGRVSGVEPSSETDGRYKVVISEYALVEGPLVPLISASPTQYFPSMTKVGIDEASLNWRPIEDLPEESTEAQTAGAITSNSPPDVGNVEGIAAMSVVMQAKTLVANRFGVPVSAVNISLDF